MATTIRGSDNWDSALAKSVSDQNNKVGQFIEQVIESKVGI